MSQFYTLDTKRTFISYAQGLFARDPYMTWNLDVKQTKIIIGDTYFISNPVIESYPSIIVSRSSVRWGMLTIGQTMSHDIMTGDSVLSDLLHGNMTYNIMAKSPQVAQRVADYLFVRITSDKNKFYEQGIHKINSIAMDNENIVKGPNGVELTNIPIRVGFSKQQAMKLTHYEDKFMVYVVTTGKEDNVNLGTKLPQFGTGLLRENIDYTIEGDLLTFLSPVPIGVKITIKYVGNITKDEYVLELDYTDGGSNTVNLSEAADTWFYDFNAVEVYHDEG